MLAYASGSCCGSYVLSSTGKTCEKSRRERGVRKSDLDCAEHASSPITLFLTVMGRFSQRPKEDLGGLQWRHIFGVVRRRGNRSQLSITERSLCSRDKPTCRSSPGAVRDRRNKPSRFLAVAPYCRGRSRSHLGMHPQETCVSGYEWVYDFGVSWTRRR